MPLYGTSRTRITGAVAASGATVTDIFGVDPIVAAMLICYSGDPLRFASASRYAAYTGTAPTAFPPAAASPIASRHGIRRVNHALHFAAIVQIRHRHSPGRR